MALRFRLRPARQGMWAVRDDNAFEVVALLA
ncbi:hypothetical protein GGR36_000977 [Niveibacterium umoris]|uniref:Uncharacterized protein n=1 Tax=Niveibacterium umoris TaxID=1193620 RepID=A0A840BJB0_9RHOO|nr:hypothetical protein [Niveibacterium umoris]